MRLKLLRADLSSGSMCDEFVDEDEVKLSIGGRGLGVKTPPKNSNPAPTPKKLKELSLSKYANP